MQTTSAHTIVSPTLAINEQVERRRAAGLATVPMGFGEAGLPVLPGLVDHLADAGRYAGYGPVAGIAALREAAAGYWSRRSLPTDPDLVIAGPGSKPLLYALVHAVEGAIALPSPCWVSYGAQAALVGHPTHAIPTMPGEGGVPDPARLDAAALAARQAGVPIGAVIITAPDNPTGTLASPATITALCEVAERHEMVVVCDEIYRDLVHDETTPFLSPAELVGHRTVVTTGLSKNLAVGGWRIGVARLPDSPLGHRLRAQVAAIASEVWSAPAQPVQRAAAWAFTEPPEVVERIAISRRLHGSVARATSRILTVAGIRHARPAAGFYLYPDFDDHREQLASAWSIRTGSQLAEVLLSELGVASLPAVAFGEPDDVLALRIATSLLYGDTDEQRTAALNHSEPETLPWISSQLDTFAAALTALITPAS